MGGFLLEQPYTFNNWTIGGGNVTGAPVTLPAGQSRSFVGGSIDAPFEVKAGATLSMDAGATLGGTGPAVFDSGSTVSINSGAIALTDTVDNYSAMVTLVSTSTFAASGLNLSGTWDNDGVLDQTTDVLREPRWRRFRPVHQ